jgi:hypothetical protein
MHSNYKSSLEHLENLKLKLEQEKNSQLLTKNFLQRGIEISKETLLFDIDALSESERAKKIENAEASIKIIESTIPALDNYIKAIKSAIEEIKHLQFLWKQPALFNVDDSSPKPLSPEEAFSVVKKDKTFKEIEQILEQRKSVDTALEDM